MIYKKLEEHTSIPVSIQARDSPVRIMPFGKQLFTQLFKGGKMKRTLLVLLLSCLFLVPGVLYAQVKDEPGLVNPGFSPEFWDSLMNGKGGEPSLQHLLDSLGYDINVATDLLPTEVWVAIAGQYKEVMLAEFAGYASQTSSGWYGHGSPADTHVIFSGANQPGDSVSFTITGCDSNGLFIKVPGTGEKSLPYVYYTEKRLNSDHKDHAKVYCSKKRPNEFIVAWEDSWNLGDADFNDLVLVYRTPNRPPVLVLPENTSFLICETETVCFNISADDDCGDTVSIAKLEGPGVFDQDAGTCCFLPASVNSTYEFVFVATDLFGAADTDTVVITVEYNLPPEIVCPDDDSVNAGDFFESSNFSTSDPKGDPVVNLCGITPTPKHMPIKVHRHVEWQTDCADAGKVFTICLEATDKCGAKDTCYFDVTVYNRPPQITCPEDDSVNAGDLFVSSNFSTSDPKGDPVVNLCGIVPTPTHMPTKVQRHVEWRTDCADAGKVFTICLETTDKCGAKDTCYFEVTVYNRPPQITCPDDDSVYAGDLFVSSNFSTSDPKCDPVVSLCGITPTPTNQPSKVGSHVEWQTDCADAGKVFTICLETTDKCGAKDTCYFEVTVYNQAPQLTCPDDDSVHAGDTLISIDFSVTDPDGDTALVTFLDINPAVTDTPTIVANHVEWITTCDEDGDYVIRLVASDSCGATDTCEFTVNVYDQPPQITCPDDDTVDNGHYSSGNFTVNDADGDSISSVDAWVDPTGNGITNVTVNGGTGAVTTTGHVEFDADSLFPGDYTIYLEATSGCETKDTCSFLITIQGRPPVITSTPDTTAFVGVPYTYDVDATGIPAPTFALITFPTGMTINPNSGLIQWTPTAVGDSDVCVEASNSAGADTQCFTISVAESAQVSILPEVLPIQCNHEDTLWIHLDEKVVDMDSAFFKIAYEDTLITPDTVIKGPALVPPGNFDLSYGIYPDSILISLAVLSGSFDGPDTILGIVFTASNYVTTAQVSIERSSLQNSEGEEIPHRAIGAEIQIDCPTSTDGDDEEFQNPSAYALSQNYPNPYNPVTQITYRLPQPGVVSLKIYNVQGQLVRTLVNEYKPAGTHSISWNGKSDLGMGVSSGIYFYRIQAGNFTETKRMILLK